MSANYEQGIVTLPLAADTGRGIRVHLNTSGQWAITGLNAQCDAITIEQGSAGDQVAAILHNAPGTRKVQVASSCTLGASLYSAASGQVDDASSGAGAVIYKAMEAATAANQIIEVMPTGRVTA